MKCNLCDKNTRCSCKGGWCPSCNSTNRQISFLNDLLKLWVSKEIIKEDLKTIRAYEWKIDSYTVYEYLTGAITKEEFDKAVEERREARKKIYKNNPKTEVIDVSDRVNPSPSHKFQWASPWSRCEYCRGIKKYVENERCPAYDREKPGSTEDKND